MFDLSAISSAKKKATENQEKLAGNYEEEYNQGLKYLEDFANEFNTETLKKATEKFFNALKCKRTCVEPYFYIAYAFFLFEEKELANKYLEFAEETNPDFVYLPNLRDLIESM